MTREAEDLLTELFRRADKGDAPPDLVRIIERIREAWRAGEFEPSGGDDDY